MKYVYLIQVEGTDIYKIGFTKNHPSKRLKNLQVGNPIKLILVDSYASKRATQVEAALHNRFSGYKVNEDEYNLMGEFFKLDLETRKNFKELCEKIDMNFQVIEENSTLYN